VAANSATHSAALDQTLENRIKAPLANMLTTLKQPTKPAVHKAATLGKATNNQLMQLNKATKAHRAALANTTTTLVFLLQLRTPTPHTPKAAKHLGLPEQLESSRLEMPTELKDPVTMTMKQCHTPTKVHLALMAIRLTVLKEALEANITVALKMVHLVVMVAIMVGINGAAMLEVKWATWAAWVAHGDTKAENDLGASKEVAWVVLKEADLEVLNDSVATWAAVVDLVAGKEEKALGDLEVIDGADTEAVWAVSVDLKEAKVCDGEAANGAVKQILKACLTLAMVYLCTSFNHKQIKSSFFLSKTTATATRMTLQLTA